MVIPPTRPELDLDLDQTTGQLRDGIESSRQLVRQSKVLIELSESESPAPAEDEGGEGAATQASP